MCFHVIVTYGRKFAYLLHSIAYAAYAKNHARVLACRFSPLLPSENMVYGQFEQIVRLSATAITNANALYISLLDARRWNGFRCQVAVLNRFQLSNDSQLCADAAYAVHFSSGLAGGGTRHFFTICVFRQGHPLNPLFHATGTLAFTQNFPLHLAC